MVEVTPRRDPISIRYWQYVVFLIVLVVLVLAWLWWALGSRWGASNPTFEGMRHYLSAGTRAPLAAKQEDNLGEALRIHRIEEVGEKRFVVLFSVTNGKGEPVVVVPPGDVSISVAASGTKVAALVEKVTPLHQLDVWGVRAYFACAMDWSGSMFSEDLTALMNDYSGFLKGLSLPYEGAVFKFNSDVERIVGLSSDPALLEAAVRKDLPQGSTALYKCMNDAMEEIGSRPHLRFELVTTDGMDNVGGISLEEVLRRARSREVSMFVLGFGWVNIDVLKQVAESTDGYYVYVPDSHELRTFFGRLAAIINNVQVAEFVIPFETPRPVGLDLAVQVGGKTLKRSR